MYKIALYDTLADAGRKPFDPNVYTLSQTDLTKPDAIMVHSTELHKIELNENLKAIVRIGAGVNTIPVDRCSEQGICVFNCPGGNANAVKELTIAATVMLMRNALQAMNWVKSLENDESAAGKTVEKGKEVFKGPELLGKTIGIIGLGAIGSRMAKACHDLGMICIGYDPYLSHTKQLELKPYVNIVSNVDEIYAQSDIITVHVPLSDETRDYISAKEIAKMKDGVYLINYARGPIVNDESVCQAIKSGKIKGYATDFPTVEQMKLDHVFYTPHLGAGTPQADENCAVMASKQIIDYLENGNITNSVNFPDVSFNRTEGDRLAIIHENKVGMLGLMTDIIAKEGLNIENLVNKARGNLAYTILDFNCEISESIIAKLKNIDGIIRINHFTSK